MANASAGGFFSGLAQQLGPVIAEHRKHEADKKSTEDQRQVDLYWGAMNGAAQRIKNAQDNNQPVDPKWQQDYESYAQQYQKLIKGSKPLTEMFGKVSQLAKHVLGGPGQQQGAPPPQQAQGDAPQPQQAQGAPQPQQSPGARAMAGPQQQAPPQQPQQANPMQRAMSEPDPRLAQGKAVEQQSFALKQDEDQKTFDVWQKRGKELGLDGRDLAEYAGSKGARLPAQQKRVSDKNVAREGYEGLWDHTVEANGDEAWAKRPDKAHNLQAGWAKTPDGKTIAVRIDPQNPGKVLDANTGQPVPEGTEQINPSVVTAQMRQDSYGSFGNYYRAALGLGKTEAEARQIAAEKIEREYNVKLSGQEQEIGIKAELSGVGGVPARPTLPPASTATPTAAPPAKTPTSTTAAPTAGTARATNTSGATPPSGTAPSKPTPGSRSLGTPGEPKPLTPEQSKQVNMYLSKLFGNASSSGGAAAQVGANKGMEALAKLTGMSPVEFQTAAAINKDKVKSIGDTVERYGAMVRLNEVLDLMGDNMVKTAKDITQTGSPLLNKAWRSINLKTVGDPKVREYLVALNDMQRQYGTLTAGGALSRAMLPVSTGEKIDQLLDPNETLEEAIASVSQIKNQAHLEKQGFQKAIADMGAEIKGSMSGKSGGSDKTPAPPSGTPKTADDLFKKLTGGK